MSGVHWDEGRLAQRIFANLASGSNLLEGYEQFDVFTDMEYLNDFGILFGSLQIVSVIWRRNIPHAVFILNTRNREAWIRSRLAHGKERSYARRAMLHYNVTSIHELTNLWRAEWEQHHREVTEFFRDKPFRLIVCRIETDLPRILDKSLPECKLNSRHYRVRGGKKSETAADAASEKKLAFAPLFLQHIGKGADYSFPYPEINACLLDKSVAAGSP